MKYCQAAGSGLQGIASESRLQGVFSNRWPALNKTHIAFECVHAGRLPPRPSWKPALTSLMSSGPGG
jgi:hypothetical protein